MIKFLAYGENSVKIGPIDPEIALLKGLFFKRKKRKLTQAKHNSPPGMHAARAK